MHKVVFFAAVSAPLALLGFTHLAAGQQSPGPAPWVKEDTIRHLYVLDCTAGPFITNGKPVMGYAVIKYSQVKGEAQWVGGRIFRWKSPDGKVHVYHARPADHGAILEDPLPLMVCDEGPYEGWVFVVPPLKGIRVVPPPPGKIILEIEPRPQPKPPAEKPPAAQAQPQPAPPSPQVLKTDYYRPALYRPERKLNQR